MLILAAVALLLAGCGKSGVITTTGEGDHAATGGERGASGTGTPSATFLHAGGAGGIATGSTTRVGGAGPVLDAAAVARALYPGLTPGTRPQAVVIVDRGDWPAALAASGLAAAPLLAPILYSEGGSLPAASATALAAMRPTGATALHRVQTICIAAAACPSGYRAMHVRARGPYVLARKIATLMSALRGGVTDGIVASLSGPRALSMPAAGLAAESGAPILFVGAKGVPSATAQAVSSLSLHTLYAIGPEAAVSEASSDALSQLAEVRRIGANGAVANSIAAAAYTDGSFGWGVQEPGHGLVFARASRPLDAPAAAPLAAGADFGPLLLLTAGSGVPRPLRRYLADIQPGYGSTPESAPVRGVYNRGWLIGDESAISIETQAELDGLLRSIPRSEAGTPPSLLP